MGNRIMINSKKVYDNGRKYQEFSNEVINIQKELDTISSDISTIWEGADANNFIVSFNKHIKNFDAIVNFLGFNGNLLKKNALSHSNIDDIFATQMERNDQDEQHRS